MPPAGRRYRRGGRAVRAGRIRRGASAAARGLGRVFGRGDVQTETVGDVAREAVNAVRNRFRRNR
jgi:hypothetical protein